MGQQRGSQAQHQTKTADQQQEQASQSVNRPQQPDDGVQEILGSRAASRQLRSELQPGNSAQPLHQMVRSLSPVSPRLQAKPTFRGISQEWGTAPSTGLVIQPKLAIGAPNDQYEQEADRVAEQVVQQLHSPEVGGAQSNQTLQRETLSAEGDELQMKPLLQREVAPEDDEELQMKPVSLGGGAIAASDELESAIQQSRGGGQPLAESIRSPMEQAFGGVDFSGVKVHTDARSDQLNRALQAKAFTTGKDIYFQQGDYEPGNRSGQELIAHELTHVVQQIGGEASCAVVRQTESRSRALKANRNNGRKNEKTTQSEWKSVTPHHKTGETKVQRNGDGTDKDKDAGGSGNKESPAPREESPVWREAKNAATAVVKKIVEGTEMEAELTYEGMEGKERRQEVSQMIHQSAMEIKDPVGAAKKLAEVESLVVLNHGGSPENLLETGIVEGTRRKTETFVKRILFVPFVWIAGRWNGNLWYEQYIGGEKRRWLERWLVRRHFRYISALIVGGILNALYYLGDVRERLKETARLQREYPNMHEQLKNRGIDKIYGATIYRQINALKGGQGTPKSKIKDE